MDAERGWGTFLDEANILSYLGDGVTGNVVIKNVNT
jgi:hypothetical protein